MSAIELLDNWHCPAAADGSGPLVLAVEQKAPASRKAR
jgi:hypothetical protein